MPIFVERNIWNWVREKGEKNIHILRMPLFWERNIRICGEKKGEKYCQLEWDLVIFLSNYIDIVNTEHIHVYTPVLSYTIFYFHSSFFRNWREREKHT